jgi:hypothetical protein
MPTLPADCAEGSKAIAALRAELAAKETEALGYLRAVGQLQDRIAETRAAALEEAAKLIEEGFDRPGIAKKQDTCAHGKFGWEDCESCAAAAIRALIPEREG